MSKNKALFTRIALVIVVSCVLAIVPFYSMLFMGVFNWHLHQPEVWQGGIELFCFGLLMVVFKIFLKKNSIPLVFFSSVYLSMNGVIIPVILDLLYFEIIMFIGHVFLHFFKKDEAESILKKLLAGIIIWGTFAIIFSLLRFGSIEKLRWMTVGLFAIALFLHRKSFGTYKTFSQKFLRYIDDSTNSIFDFICIVLLSLIFLALFAKTNTAQDYDSLWYGLRPERVLFGKNGFYDNLGYFSFVNYYPKLVELFLAPVSDLGDYSFIQCANVFFLLFIAHIVKEFLDSFSDFNKTTVKLLICSVVSIPALANTAATAKPDIAGVFFCLAAFYYISVFFKTKTNSDFLWGMICLALCTGTKLTYLLWGGILFFVSLVFFAANLRKNKMQNISLRLDNSILIICFLCLFFVFGLHLRTFLLTGYPIYPLFLSLFEKLGFSANMYMLTSATKSAIPSFQFTSKSMLRALYGVTFNPKDLPHVIMLWTSNLLPISILFWLFLKKKTISMFNFVLMMIYIVVSVYYLTIMRAADGNYFILPIIVVSLILLSSASCESKFAFNFVGALLILTQVPIMFVSHSSWQYGTKKFTPDLFADNFDSHNKTENILLHNGLFKINDEVKKLGKTERVICNGYENIIFRLDCAVEPAKFLAYRSRNGGILSSYENFANYIQKAAIKALIIFDSDGNQKYKDFVKKYVSENLVERIIYDEKVVCYILYALPQGKITVSGKYPDKWLGDYAKIAVRTEDAKHTLACDFYNPTDSITNEKLKIFVNESFFHEIPIQSGSWTVSVPLKENAVSCIEFKTDYRQEITNGDKRTLSLILSDVRLVE